MHERKKLEKQSIEIPQHYYFIKGLGKFDNMKDLRMKLKVSRQAIRMLMEAGVIIKINEVTVAKIYLKMQKEDEDENRQD